jgi:hypothetical protein
MYSRGRWLTLTRKTSRPPQDMTSEASWLDHVAPCLTSSTSVRKSQVVACPTCLSHIRAFGMFSQSAGNCLSCRVLHDANTSLSYKLLTSVRGHVRTHCRPDTQFSLRIARRLAVPRNDMTVGRIHLKLGYRHRAVYERPGGCLVGTAAKRDDVLTCRACDEQSILRLWLLPLNPQLDAQSTTLHQYSTLQIFLMNL